MKILIVYDSFFGNTQKIAKSIASSFESGSDVKLKKVDEISPEEISGIDLLIVGSPTRKFRPSKLIMDFLKSIHSELLRGVKVTAFDTRIAAEDVNSKFLKIMVKFFGYAAKPIANKLVKKGGYLIAPPLGFYVTDMEGPLKEGETDRAGNWIKFI